MKKQVVVPSAGESITEGTLSSWIKQGGQAVKSGELIAEVETDKATIEINAPISGVLSILVGKDKKVKIGEIIAEIDEEGLPKTSSKVEEEKSSLSSSPVSEIVEDSKKEASSKESSIKPFPSPSAERMIEEEGIDVALVKGSGKEGRIIKSDVQSLVRGGEKEISSYGGETSKGIFREPLSPMKKVLMNHFQAEEGKKLLGTLYDEIDMSELLNIKENYGDEFELETEEELSYIVFFLQAVSLGLDRFSAFKSTLEGDEVIYHEGSDIALSFNGSEAENVMAVLRDVDIKGFGELEGEIRTLEEEIEQNKISMKEMEGGMFSVVSSADRGSFLSSPPLFGSQSGTLCLHRIEDRAVARDGEVVVAPVMQISLTYNRFLVDEGEAVDFLVYIKSLLEKPIRLLLYRE